MKRDRRLDSIRGLLLVIMTVDHLGGPLLAFTDQPLGFVSALSGFIFLSGFVYSRVYGALAQTPRALWRKSAARAWRVYRYHLVLLLLIPVLLYVSPLHAASLDEFVRPFSLTASGAHYALMAVLLLHQPVLMDVLPLYALFLLVSPLLIWALRRRQLPALIAVSVAIWIAARYVDPIASLSWRVCTGCRPGYLNLMAWQLIWTLGVCIGWPALSGPLLRFACKPRVFGAAAIVALALFLIRHGLSVGDLNPWTQLHSLGILRVLNLIALLVVISVALARVPAGSGVPWLSFIGRYSLQVFAFHVAIAYLLSPYLTLIADRAGSVGYTAFSLLVLASLSLPAILQSWRERRTSGSTRAA
jgi:hypothetical protein